MIIRYVKSAFKAEVSPGKLALLLIVLKVSFFLLFWVFIFTAASPSGPGNVASGLAAYAAALFYAILAFSAPYLLWVNMKNASALWLKFLLYFAMFWFVVTGLGVWNIAKSMIIGAG